MVSFLNLTWRQVNLATRIMTLRPEDTKEGRGKRVPIHRNLVPILESCAKVRVLGVDRVFLLDGHAPE